MKSVNSFLKHQIRLFKEFIDNKKLSDVIREEFRISLAEHEDALVIINSHCNSQDNIVAENPTHNTAHSEISLLENALHLISGDYCSYNHRDLAIKDINAVLAKLQNAS